MTPRPAPDSPDVISAYAAAVLDEIKSRLGNAWTMVDEDALPDLQQAISYASDAFARAVFLRQRGWRITEEMVPALSERSGLRIKAHSAAVRKWVLLEGVRFPTKEGQRVMFRPEGSDVTANGLVEAVIAGEALALVRVFGPKADNTSGGVLHRLPAERVERVLVGNGSVPSRAVLMTVGFQRPPSTAPRPVARIAAAAPPGASRKPL